MARIETYSPQASVNVPGVARLPGSVDAPRLGQAAAGAAAALGQKAAGQADIAQAQGYAAGQLGRFGGDVSSAGADVMAYQQQQQAIADTAWLAKATAETKLSTHISEAKLFSGAGDASVGPTGYADAATGNIKAFGEAYAKNAPSAKAKQAYENWLVGEQADAKIRAYDHQQAKQEQQTKADFITALDAHTRLVGADPTQFDTAWNSAEQDFAAAARWMDPATLATMRAKTRHDMELTRAQTLQKSDPLAFQREVAPHQYDIGSGVQQPKGWADNPLYSHLQADEVAALLQGADSAVVQQHNAAVTAQDFANGAKVDELWRGIHDGVYGPSEILQGRKEGWLYKPTDIAKIDALVKQQQEDGKTLATAGARLAAGEHFNWAMPEDVKQVDALAKSVLGDNPDVLIGKQPTSVDAGQGSLVATNPMALAQMKAFSLTARTGVLAPTIADTIRGGIKATDPQRMMAAYQLWDKLLHDPSTAAATKNAFSDADMKNYFHYAMAAPNLPPDLLVKELNPSMDPKSEQYREENRTAWKANHDKQVSEKKDTLLPNFLNSINPAGMFNYPQEADDARTHAALRKDLETAAQWLSGFSTDPVQIETQAIEMVKQHWGITDTGPGHPVVIQYPPERSFPPINGSFDWMHQQLEGVVKVNYPGAEDWQVITVPETEEAVGLKVTPRWGIVVHDEHGVRQVIAPQASDPPGWPFNYQAAYMQDKQQADAARGSLMDVRPASPTLSGVQRHVMDLMDQRAGRRVGSPAGMAEQPGWPGKGNSERVTPLHVDTPSEKFIKSLGSGMTPPLSGGGAPAAADEPHRLTPAEARAKALAHRESH